MSSIFKLMLPTPKFIYPPANPPVRPLVLPIDISYLTVNVYRFYTELRSTFDILVGSNFKHVFSFQSFCVYNEYAIKKPAIATLHGLHIVFHIGHCTVIHCDAGGV